MIGYLFHQTTGINGGRGLTWRSKCTDEIGVLGKWELHRAVQDHLVQLQTPLSVSPNLVVFTVVIFWNIFDFFSRLSLAVLPENSASGGAR